MIRLPENITNTGLAMPGSTPRTLIEVDSENLPYACQCPCCGALFNIPEGLLYKIEEDSLADGDFASDVEGEGMPDVNIDVESSGGTPSEPTSSVTAESDSGAGDIGDSII